MTFMIYCERRTIVIFCNNYGKYKILGIRYILNKLIYIKFEHQRKMLKVMKKFMLTIFQFVHKLEMTKVCIVEGQLNIFTKSVHVLTANSNFVTFRLLYCTYFVSVIHQWNRGRVWFQLQRKLHNFQLETNSLYFFS